MIVGTLPVLLVAAIAHRVARLLDLDGGTRRFAVALGAWTLAIEGLYLTPGHEPGTAIAR
jgi:hypothetical protein